MNTDNFVTTFDVTNILREPDTGVVVTADIECSSNYDIWSVGEIIKYRFDEPTEAVIPYEELTEEQVLSWVTNKEEVAAKVELELLELIERNTLLAGLPWEKAEIDPTDNVEALDEPAADDNIPTLAAGAGEMTLKMRAPDRVTTDENTAPPVSGFASRTR